MCHYGVAAGRDVGQPMGRGDDRREANQWVQQVLGPWCPAEFASAVIGGGEEGWRGTCR